eukprot:1146805-Pelagomonas_calceolata.AAC.1
MTVLKGLALMGGISSAPGVKSCRLLCFWEYRSRREYRASAHHDAFAKNGAQAGCQYSNVPPINDKM